MIRTYEQALAYFQNAQYQQVVIILKEFLLEQPSQANAWHLMALSYRALQKLEMAESALKQAITLEPNQATYWLNMGAIVQQQNKLPEAVHCFQQAIKLNPQLPEAYKNMGQIFEHYQQYDQAIQCFQQALKIRPNFEVAHCHLSFLYYKLENIEQAMFYSQQVLKYNSKLSGIYSLRGFIYLAAGQMVNAFESLEKATNLSCLPEEKKRIFEALLFYQRAHPHLTLKKCFSNTLKWTQFLRKTSQSNYQFLQSKHLSRPLRIGYVSGNFQAHSNSSIVESLFRFHDRKQVTVIAFSNTKKQDSYTSLFKQVADQWFEIHQMNDQEVANVVHEQEVDILVDLMGITQEHRLDLFTYRAAPLQVTGLGFGETTGMTQFDYQISDKYLRPPHRIPFNSEKIIYINSLMRWSIPSDSLGIDELCVKEEYSSEQVIFGCGNQLYKINEQVIACWAQILQHLPGAKLHLKAPVLDHSFYRKSIYTSFQKHGISSEQLIMSGLTSLVEHMAYYQGLDIALDPFPCTGGISSCEVLWMGLPLVTINQGTHTGVGLLHYMNHPEWIANSIEEYIQIALDLAKNIENIRKKRLDFRQQFEKSLICNRQNFTREVEKAYRMMWFQWCKNNYSQPPIS